MADMEDHRRTYNTFDGDWVEPVRKRMRITPPDDNDEISDQHTLRPYAVRHEHGEKDHDKSIAIASTAKLVPQAVGPFYAKHIPRQYAPLGDPTSKGQGRAADDMKDSNSKYCYRHRPDVLCRKQADEHTMDKLQKELEQLPQDDRQGIVQVWSLFSAAPSKHRNLMLQGILAQCCFPQLSFLSSNVRELIRIDFVAALPPELAYRCLSFLDTASLCKAAQVSQKWRQMADDDVVWHHMCEQHIDRKCTKCGWGLPLLEKKRLRETKRLIQLRAAGSLTEETKSQSAEMVTKSSSFHPTSSDRQSNSQATGIPALPMIQSEIYRQTRPWKDVYKDRFKVGTNWKYGRYKNQILKGHSNGVMALSMYDNILATGSYDDTIKIWDLDTGKELRTLYGHTMGIRCLQMDGKKLISGSLDKTIKVWDWRKGVCLATHTGHNEGVIGLHFDSNILVSGSIDKTARVWDFKDKSVSVLRGHTNWVNSVRIDTASRTIFTASDDCTIKLWDLDTKRCILTYEGHVGQVQQVVLLPPEFDAEEDGNDSASTPGSPDSHRSSASSFNNSQNSPVLHHHETNQTSYFETPVDLFASFEDGRPRPPRYMLSSGLDSTIRLWEVSTGRCVRVFFGHVEGIWALAADTLRIVSGSEDSMVKVWDPRSDKCDKTYTGHRGPVTCVGLSDSRMVSGGEDGEVRVYCFSD